MKPELFHRWYDPASQRVMEFLTANNISHLVEFVDMDDEEQLGTDRLMQICGHDDVPCLIVDMKPITNEREIIQWLRDNLIGQQTSALT